MKRIFCVFLTILLTLLAAVPAAPAEDMPAVFIPDRLVDLDGVPAIEDIWEDKVFFLSVRFYHEVIEISDDKTEPLGRGVELWFTDFHGNPFVPDWAKMYLGLSVYQLVIDGNGHALVYLEEWGDRYGTIPSFSAGKTYADGTDISIDYIVGTSLYGPEPPSSDYFIKKGHYTHFDSHFFARKERTAGMDEHRLMCVPVRIDYTLPDTDFFLTGMENAVTTITYRRNTVASVCGDGQDPEQQYTHFDGFYSVAFVDTDYPAGNYIMNVFTEWRDDKKQALASYKIIYHVAENELYRITYAPQTTSIFEDHTGFGPGVFTYRGVNYNISGDEAYTDLGKQDVCGKNIPGMKTAAGDYVHHYTADEVLRGTVLHWVPDWTNEEDVKKSTFAESGSGDNLNKWYDLLTGRQVRSIRYPCTYFVSPRVTR